MAAPTTHEVQEFVANLRDRASFLGDPALYSAADFIERLGAQEPDDPSVPASPGSRESWRNT